MVHKGSLFLKKNEQLQNKLKSINHNSTSAKSSSDGFTVLTNRVTYIVSPDGSRHSYTFYIKRDWPIANISESLILNSQPGGSYKAYIITYRFGENPNNNYPFEVIDYEKIENYNYGDILQRTACVENTYTVMEVEHDCYEGIHSGSSEAGECVYKGEDAPYSTYIIFASTRLCFGGGSGGGGSGDPYPNGDPGTGPVHYDDPNNPYDPLDPDTGMSSPIGPEEGTTSPTVADVFGYFGFSSVQISWLENHITEAEKILNFINSNGKTQQAVDFGLLALDALMNGKVADFTNHVENYDFHAETPEILAFEQGYREDMSQSEIVIFDGLTRFQQLDYLYSAFLAFFYAEFYFENTPMVQYNGQGDAYRHALWNALGAAKLGESNGAIDKRT